MDTAWRSRVALVTGATGLLGGWLTQRLLAEGASVVALVRDWVPDARLLNEPGFERVRIVRGDIEDQQCLERVLSEYEVSTVFHLAAQTIVGTANRCPIPTFEANIAGTWRLLEACRRSPWVRGIVLASSDKAYGAQETLPYTEDTPLQGRHPYDVSKSCADLIAQSYAHSYDLPVAITRCGNLFGGGDLNFNRLVPGTIRSVLDGEPPVIRSNGRFVRDYFYVEDAASAYIRLADRLHAEPDLAGEAFNFGSYRPMTALEMVDSVLAATGSNLKPLILDEARNEIPDQHLDCRKAHEVLGWQSEFPLEDALARTIDWYRRHWRGALRSAA
jgi:CDP-glucose 4,6-dehydratase